jgi:hypothetical protein
MSRERVGRVDQSGVLSRLGTMARAFERVVQLCEPTTIPPLRVLLVPAASARPGLGPGDKPVHLAFGLCLALLFRTVRGCLKEGVDRSTDVSIDDRVVGAQLGLQEKLCAGFQNGRELRPQRRNEVRHGQRNYAQADERKRTAFQYVIENSHDLSIAAWLKWACKHRPSANASAKVARTISQAGAMSGRGKAAYGAPHLLVGEWTNFLTIDG